MGLVTCIVSVCGDISLCLESTCRVPSVTGTWGGHCGHPGVPPSTSQDLPVWERSHAPVSLRQLRIFLSLPHFAQCLWQHGDKETSSPAPHVFSQPGCCPAPEPMGFREHPSKQSFCTYHKQGGVQVVQTSIK